MYRWTRGAEDRVGERGMSSGGRSVWVRMRPACSLVGRTCEGDGYGMKRDRKAEYWDEDAESPSGSRRMDESHPETFSAGVSSGTCPSRLSSRLRRRRLAQTHPTARTTSNTTAPNVPPTIGPILGVEPVVLCVVPVLELELASAVVGPDPAPLFPGIVAILALELAVTIAPERIDVPVADCTMAVSLV